jgi:hypothetical protein
MHSVIYVSLYTQRDGWRRIELRVCFEHHVQEPADCTKLTGTKPNSTNNLPEIQQKYVQYFQTGVDKFYTKIYKLPQNSKHQAGDIKQV